MENNSVKMSEWARKVQLLVNRMPLDDKETQAEYYERLAADLKQTMKRVLIDELKNNYGMDDTDGMDVNKFVRDLVDHTPGVHSLTEPDGKIFITVRQDLLEDMCKYCYERGKVEVMISNGNVLKQI